MRVIASAIIIELKKLLASFSVVCVGGSSVGYNSYHKTQLAAGTPSLPAVA